MPELNPNLDLVGSGFAAFLAPPDLKSCDSRSVNPISTRRRPSSPKRRRPWTVARRPTPVPRQ